MPRIAPAFRVLLAVSILGTCGTALLVGQVPRIRDSAGIQVVENPSRAKAAIAFRIADRPTLDIGGLQADLDAELGPQSQAVRLSDGRVAVADGAAIKYFNAAGKFTRLVGRKGNGPGELRFVGRICRLRGDTIFGFDTGNNRYVVVDAAGVVVRTVPTTTGMMSPTCLDDGSLIRTEGRVDYTDRDLPLAHYVGMGTDGVVRHDLGTLAGPMIGSVYRSSIIAAGDRLYFGDSRTAEVRLLDAAGKVVRVIRTDDPPVPVTDAEASAGKGVLTITMTPVGRDGSPAGSSNTITKRGATWPAFERLMVDATGRLWVEDNRRSELRGWTAFDAAGKIIGRLVPPKHTDEDAWEIQGFGASDVLVRHKDGDGAIHFSWYPLLPVR